LAVIDGVCMGGGLELALACRYRIASDSPRTRLGLPETRLGVIPGWGGTQRLPKVVGMRQAPRMILTGSAVDAAKALRIGLIDRVIPSGATDGDAHGAMDDAIASTAAEIAGGTGGLGARLGGGRAKSWVDRLLDDTAPGRWLVARGAR